LGGKGVVIVRY